jgi:hypothetical protein
VKKLKLKHLRAAKGEDAFKCFPLGTKLELSKGIKKVTGVSESYVQVQTDSTQEACRHCVFRKNGEYLCMKLTQQGGLFEMCYEFNEPTQFVAYIPTLQEVKRL